MSLQSLDKEVGINTIKTEVVPKDNSVKSEQENSLADKKKTEQETISIKEPNLFQLRDFFKDKVNETGKEKQLSLENRVKEINKDAAKTAREPEIRITKSAEGVIKLISKARKENINTINNDVSVSKEPVKEFIKSTEEVIQLKQIIEDEFNKAKEGLNNLNKESKKDFVKADEEKIILSKQLAKSTIKSVEVKSTLAKEQVKEIIRTTEGKIKIEKQPAKPTIAAVENKINLPKETTSKIIKTAEEKSTITQIPSKTIIQRIEPEKNPPQKLEQELNQSIKQENIIAQRGLRELSSLSIEDKKSYFKAKKDLSPQVFKRGLMITIGLLILSASFIVYFSLSKKAQDIQPDVTMAQTVSESSKDVIEQTSPDKVAAIQDNGKSKEGINPIPDQTTKEFELPVPPEIPEMIETPASKLVDNFEVENKETTKNLEEKTPIAPPKEEMKIEEEPAFFVAVEEMPEPLGGLAEIQKRIVYPQMASLAGVEGKVFVRALVDESGTVASAEVIKGIGAGCDEAALEAVLKSKFKPGIQRGKPVKVQVTIPIVFRKR